MFTILNRTKVKEEVAYSYLDFNSRAHLCIGHTDMKVLKSCISFCE